MLRMLSSAGRASPLHGGGHGSESLSIHHLINIKSTLTIYGWLAKWSNAADCKSVPFGSVVRIHDYPYILGYSQVGKASDFDSDIS